MRKVRLDKVNVEHEDTFAFDRLNPHRTFVQEFEDRETAERLQRDCRETAEIQLRDCRESVQRLCPREAKNWRFSAKVVVI